jgi:predicted ABC-type ATPase
MAENQKWVWIVTGPNGAGKTSIRQHLPSEITSLPSLNLDAYAAEAQKRYNGSLSLEDRYLKGGEEMMEDFRHMLDSGQSFSFETTVPTGVLGQSFAKMQAAGWKIGVIAVGVTTPETCQARVNERVSKGGHNAQTANPTWQMFKNFAPAALRISDRFMLYDNSGDTPVLIASKDQRYGHVNVHQPSNSDYMKGILGDIAAQQSGFKGI